MKVSSIILTTIIAIAGCTNQAKTAIADTTHTISKMTVTDTLTYLALGDSYTIGEAVPQQQSFPFQLTALLAAHSVNVAPPTVIATTGWTTDQLINAVNTSGIHTKTYDIVTLLIGVNDQYRGLSQSNYRTKFIQVLNTAISLAKGDKRRVFVLSIPDWGVTPFAKGQDDIIGPQIDQFNSINKEESQKAGVNYLDITGLSRQAKTDLELVAEDDLHPSGKMYGQWVARLEPMIREQLKVFKKND